MYHTPQLYGTHNHICHVPAQEIIEGRRNCRFRHSIACDKDIFKLCTILQAENNWNVPSDAYQAIDLYLYLREKMVPLIHVT